MINLEVIIINKNKQRLVSLVYSKRLNTSKILLLIEGDMMKTIIKMAWNSNIPVIENSELANKIFNNYNINDEIDEKLYSSISDTLCSCYTTDDIDSFNATKNVNEIKLLEIRVGAELYNYLDAVYYHNTRFKSQELEFGFEMPYVKVTNDSSLLDNEYCIYLRGVLVSKWYLEIDKLLIIGTTIDKCMLSGQEVKEPIFGLDAIWINKELKDTALEYNNTLVDALTVISTHLGEIIKNNIEDLFTMDSLINMIDLLKVGFPTTVEKTMKSIMFNQLFKVCKALLHEGIHLTDFLTIVEAIIEFRVSSTTNFDELLEFVRVKLWRLITNTYLDVDGILHIITIKSELELALINKLEEVNNRIILPLNIDEVKSLVEQTRKIKDALYDKDIALVSIVVDPSLRKDISYIFKYFDISIAVLSHAELDIEVKFSIEGSIEFDL